MPLDPVDPAGQGVSEDDRVEPRRGARVTAPRRVLVVDDNAEFQRVARALLDARGYCVVGEAGCAATACEAVAALRPDAVLLDVRLGPTCGFALAAELGRGERAPAILMMSSHDDGEGDARARASGACGFVLKHRLVTTDLERFWPSARSGAGGGAEQ